MEQTQVVIVGAGPSGLALGLALAKLHVQSVILEKETEVPTDPRGVYLAGDAVRILHDLGIGHDMPDIGHEVQQVNFHQSTFATKPFFSMKVGNPSALQQAVPEGILQIQPRLEDALRREVQRSQWCTLRKGCTVLSRPSEDPPTVEYVAADGVCHGIRGEWLVGADGKVGVVRKHFLEPTASIKQETGRYPYDGTWVAANLRITAPTPQTHPQFPLWDLGYSPDEVYDLFWPQGWHFCCPPGKATAAGRFGPHSERLWRHEFRQDWDDSMDAEALLWEHIKPMITLEASGRGDRFSRPVQYPLDCINIIRCRPFRFTHKVVNRWFHGRTILIGDAAHVFPPFAGQGIVSGLRDAHQLAWRIALLLGGGRSDEPQLSSDSILGAWAAERRRSVDDAARSSIINGRMCNDPPSLWLRAVLWSHMLLESVPFLPSFPDPEGVKERRGLIGVEDGFFLKERGGGARLSQIHVQSSSSRTPALSDRLLHRSTSAFTVVIISSNDNHEKLYKDATEAMERFSLSPTIMSRQSIIAFLPRVGAAATSGPKSGNGKADIEVFSPELRSEVQDKLLPGYDDNSYVDRLGKSTKFAIVRPDFFVFACADDIEGFVECLASLKKMLCGA